MYGEFQTRAEKIHQFATWKDRSLHALRIATQRGGVFMSEANGHVGVWCEAITAWKLPMVELMMSPIMLFLENG